MAVYQWAELDRARLSAVLPSALVIVPLGAVEQHGDHLPTGTDIFLSTAVATRAAHAASDSSDLDVVITPPLSFGASDHHLPFGGTLSISSATLLGMLGELLDSIATAGARRVILVNGHGGNSGVCHAAAAAASARLPTAIAHVDYWKLLAPPEAPTDYPVPGHGGRFETALVLAVHPDLVREREERVEPVIAASPRGIEVHSGALWSRINGFTDRPDLATADLGAHYLEELVHTLAAALVELGVAE